MKRRILLAAKHSVIEPLGLIHLKDVCDQEGWESRIFLVPNHDFSTLNSFLDDFNPDILGFTLYTGNHIQTFEYLDRLRQERQHLKTIFGGPHATYFPEECTEHSDFVVLSQGLNGLRRILRNEVEPGIVHLTQQEPFPQTNRTQFYRDSISHGKSRIKSVIASTGCPYSCTYCYNSSPITAISSALSSIQLHEMTKALEDSSRLFPRNQRSVDEVVLEVRHILEISPETKVIYFQDDVFGSDIRWMRQFAQAYKSLIPFHAQTRFEYADPKKPQGKERIDLLRQAGCSGLTLAIESADPVVREEVLNRPMKEDLLFRVLHNLNKLGFRVRTEQMLGLPYGATTKETPVGLEADLETLSLNVRLRQETGLPTVPWASIFAPYRGTAIGDYCRKHGFYKGVNNDVPDTFFDRSVLNFPRYWVGPSLSLQNQNAWLSSQELEQHRDKLSFLRDHFDYFALLERGDRLARKFLSENDSNLFSVDPSKRKLDFALSEATRRHLYDEVLYGI